MPYSYTYSKNLFRFDRKNMITLFKLYWKTQKVIGIKSISNVEEEAYLMRLSNIQYIQELNCWLLPYSVADFNSFKALALPFRVEKPSGPVDDLPSKDEHSGIAKFHSSTVKNIAPTIIPTAGGLVSDIDNDNITTKGLVRIQWNGEYFRVYFPYSKEDVALMKSLKGSYWNVKLKCWLARSVLSNLQKLQEYFCAWPPEKYSKVFELISIQMNPCFVTLFTSPQYEDKVVVKLEGFNIDVNFIKKIAGRKYDKVFKRWIIPNTEKCIIRLIAHYEEQGAKIINRIPKNKGSYLKSIPQNAQRMEQLLSKCNPKSQPTIQKYAQVLFRQQYGWKTIVQYSRKLFGLMEYYNYRDLLTLQVEDVHRYLVHLAMRDASNSLLNVVYSAIKFYFEKVEYVPDFQIEKLTRPRKGKYLPTILSVKEVDRMLRTVTNLKHLTILYTIYGGGLRLNELIHLRLQDIHWDRNQLKISQGKGKKQRMVMLSQALKNLLEKYFNEYKPQYWLFEGKDGSTQYSPRSVQVIVKKASQIANISRKVSPHTLRHCFATHLLDHGTDIRYIQELLGHKDIKTTLIYTHVTTHSLKQIQSPLDQLPGGEFGEGKRSE